MSSFVFFSLLLLYFSAFLFRDLFLFAVESIAPTSFDFCRFVNLNVSNCGLSAIQVNLQMIKVIPVLKQNDAAALVGWLIVLKKQCRIIAFVYIIYICTYISNINILEITCLDNRQVIVFRIIWNVCIIIRSFLFYRWNSTYCVNVGIKEERTKHESIIFILFEMIWNQSIKQKQY